MFQTKYLVTAVLACCCTATSYSQTGRISGIPGDGIPDFYYFSEEATILMSSGLVSRPAGFMVVDTDGTDIVGVLIGGPDVSENTFPGCALCDGMNLPGIDYLANVSSWTVGYTSAGRTEWIRTNPLQGRGFVGVIGEQWIDGDGTAFPWSDCGAPPFLDCLEPGQPLAYYPANLTANDFNNTLSDSNGLLWEVGYGGDMDGLKLTNVTLVPEPTTPRYLAIVAIAISLRWRFRSM
jgi:hypothetical protein